MPAYFCPVLKCPGPRSGTGVLNIFAVNSTEISSVKITQQIKYLLHSETRVPSTSTTIPSAINKKVKSKGFLEHAAETQIIAYIISGIWEHLKIK